MDQHLLAHDMIVWIFWLSGGAGGIMLALCALSHLKVGSWICNGALRDQYLYGLVTLLGVLIPVGSYLIASSASGSHAWPGTGVIAMSLCLALLSVSFFPLVLDPSTASESRSNSTATVYFMKGCAFLMIFSLMAVQVDKLPQDHFAYLSGSAAIQTGDGVRSAVAVR